MWPCCSWFLNILNICREKSSRRKALAVIILYIRRPNCSYIRLCVCPYLLPPIQTMYVGRASHINRPYWSTLSVNLGEITRIRWPMGKITTSKQYRSVNHYRSIYRILLDSTVWCGNHTVVITNSRNSQRANNIDDTAMIDWFHRFFLRVEWLKWK